MQILFAAAFASHRSDLINRAQLVGHLVRAAALVPMVIAFSYVGLVVSQVAMNALVLGLLVAWAPREWGLVGGGGGQLARAVTAAAVPAGLYLALVAPRLPDPLSVGTVARIGVMAAIGVAWLILYGVAATALRLPGTHGLRRRLRRRAVPARAALMVACLALPARAGAQARAGWTPLPEGHWSLAVVEWMEARGELPAGTSSVRPITDVRVAALLSPAGAGARFEEERGEGAGLASELRGELGLGANDEGATLRLGIAAGRQSSVPFGFAVVEKAASARLVRGGVGVRVGKLWAAAGRERVRLGGGVGGGRGAQPLGLPRRGNAKDRGTDALGRSGGACGCRRSGSAPALRGRGGPLVGIP